MKIRMTTLARSLSYCLGRCRFSVLVLAAGAALLFSDQGIDLLVACGERDADYKMRFAIAALGWALSVWWWSRLLLDVNYPDPPSDTRSYAKIRLCLPRILGACAFIVLVGASLQARRYRLAAWAAAGLLVFLTLVVGRRRAASSAARRLRASSLGALRERAGWFDVAAFSPAPPHADVKRALSASRFSTGFAIFMATGFVFLSVSATFAPVWLGSRTGALFLFFFWAMTWLPIGSFLSRVADVWGVPLLSCLTLLALGSSLCNDNHGIRAAGTDDIVKHRRTLSEALHDWAKRNPRSDPAEPVPFVVVATAGGGIRAAYWTATVLGALQDGARALRDRTFAISGVSGGALGATVFRALLDVPPERLRGCSGEAEPEEKTSVKTCGQRVLAEEFLGPLAAALLYPDLAQRFVPFPLFPDRAEALEQSWESAFEAQTGVDQLSRSLSDLPERSGPHLFLNATWADNGRRIIASDVSFGGDCAMARANDQLAELTYDVRLSTAAHNSARFPFVSPAGSWRDPRSRAGRRRLQDGGLFENYGAETAIELLDAACTAFRCPPFEECPPGSDTRPRIRPIVVLITSDPTLPADFASPPAPPISLFPEIWTTFSTYERVRNGRGAEEGHRLLEWADRHKLTERDAPKGQTRAGYFLFRMCNTNLDGAGREVEDNARQPPLGWALSAKAMERIEAFLSGPRGPGQPEPSCYADNDRAKRVLVELLGGDGNLSQARR